MNWFENWFNSKYYNILYSNRDNSEAIFLIDNILKKIQPSKESIFLDLGCGQGRHAIHLNRKGFITHGIDISEKQLREAKKNENKNLKFYLSDMRNFNTKYKYDFILNLFTSFGYFEDNKNNQQVFNHVDKTLKKKGYFIIDFFNSHKVISQLKNYETKNINGITFHIKKKYDNNFVYKQISIQDQKNNYTFTEKVRLITKEDFINYSKGLNMKLLYTFGDYNLNEYNHTSSERLILVFQKTN